MPVSCCLYITLTKKKTVKVFNENSVRRRLAVRTPQGSGEEYDSKMQRVHLEQRNRFIVYIVCAAVCFAGVIASGVYLLKSSNFASHDKSESMLNMLINVGPWVLIGFLACLFTTFFEKFSITREITVLKQLIASNKGNPVISADKSENKVWLKIKAFFCTQIYKARRPYRRRYNRRYFCPCRYFRYRRRARRAFKSNQYMYGVHRAGLK